MEITEMFAQIKSGELSAHSELGTRDESKQTRIFETRIQKMKTVTGIYARALVMKDLVVPFNPFTFEEDEKYNSKSKFRPILLVSQAIEGIKDAAFNDPEMKAKWEELLGIEFTPGKATMEEYLAFKSKEMIKPRVMSYPTVSCNFGGKFGFPEFRTPYMVDPAGLNENNTYDFDGEVPPWHLAAQFFMSIIRPEWNDKEAKLKRDGASKEAIADERSKFMNKCPIRFVSPTNLMPFFYFPHGELPPKFDLKNVRDIEKHIRYYGKNDKWVNPLKDAMTNPMYDTDIDFFDFTIRTPSSSDTKQNGQVYTDDDGLALFQAMTITNTDNRMDLHTGKTFLSEGQVKPNSELFASFFEAARVYFQWSQEESFKEDNSGETFEKIMAASNRFRRIDTVLDNFLAACNDVFLNEFVDSPYFTERVRNANAKFFVMMNPDNAIALASEDDEDLDEARAAERLTITAIMEEDRKDQADPSSFIDADFTVSEDLPFAD